MSDENFLFIGDHAETLGSGRRVAPGDELPADAVDQDHPIDQRLINDGLLVSVRAETKQERTQREKTAAEEQAAADKAAAEQAEAEQAAQAAANDQETE